VNIVWGSRNSVVYNKRCAMPYNWPDIDKNATRQEIDDFFLLDMSGAIEQYTIKSERFPEDVEENLFQCWSCEKHRNYSSFRINHLTPSFFDVVANIVTAHDKFTCCEICAYERCVRPYICDKTYKKRRLHD